MARRAKGEGLIRQLHVTTCDRKPKCGCRWEGRVDFGKDEDGKRVRHSVYGKTKQEVSARLLDLLARREAGSPARDATATVRQVVDRWVTGSLAASDRRASTKATYESLLRRHVVPTIGGVRLDRLTPSHVEQVVVSMRAAGVSASTMRMVHTALRQAIDVAVRDGLVRRNVVRAVKRPAASRTEARYLTPDELHRLLATAEGDRLEALWVLLALTGMRRGEALALRWSDVDLDAGTARVERTVARIGGELTFSPAKTERSRRTVPLSSPVVAALREHRRRQLEERMAAPGWNDVQGLVFVTRIGTPIEPHNAWRSFKALAAKAGLEDVKIHTLRHSVASAALAAGVPIKVVADLLGHSSTAITADVYSHVTEVLARSAADDVARVVLGP